MCMLRITTYDECWAQYTHVLICSVESHNNNQQDSPGGCVDFLECPNLKSEHIHIKHPKCVCKTYPSEGVEPVHCTRMWGGSFVGDVNCSMLPGSAVRFEFRGREWQDCTNVQRLLKVGLRFVPDGYKPPITARVWHDSEWDGDGKLVNWRDTDWVKLSQKGLNMWQRQQQSKASRDHGTAIQDRSGLDEESQTYDNVRLAKGDISSTQNILRRSKGQLLLPVANRPVNYYADKINDLIVNCKKQRKDHSEAATYDQYMAPPSIGQPRFQREPSIITNNLLTTDQARRRSQLDLFEEANAREKSNAERKAQGNGPSPSNFAVPTLQPVPTRTKMDPFWEAARTLQERREKERIKSGVPLANGMQSLTGPMSSTVIRARDDSRILQYANQTVNAGAQVSASREVSSAPAYGSESSQNHGWRKKDEKRSNFLQNTYKQRLTFRDNILKDETKAAGQPAQADTQHSYMHSSAQRNKGTLVNGLQFPLWNGVPESVVSYAYNNTLPESDDRKFILHNYSPTKQPAEEVTMAVPHENSYSAPQAQAPSFALKYWLTAPRQTSNAVVEGHFSSSRMLNGIEIVDKGVSNPESNPVENLTQTQRKAEPRVMRMTQEVKSQSQTQPVDQKGPTQDVPQAQSQPTALLQESSYLQESPDKKAMRKLQKLEDVSMIADNKSVQEILHDQSQLDTFLQDFTPLQQDIAWETWMVEKDKVDAQYSELLNIPDAVGDRLPSGLQANSRITNHPGRYGEYEKNEFDTYTDSDGKVNTHDDELTYPSFSRVLRPRPVHPVRPVRPLSPVRTYTSKELLNFVWQKHDAKLLVNLLRDQKRLDVYLEKFPMQQKKVAQDTWSNELRIALKFLQSTLDKIGISVINEREEDKVKARANEQKHLDYIESEVNKRLQEKFLSRLRAEQDKEAEKEKAHRRRIEMQLQFINTGKFSTQIEFSDGEIVIKKKRKRGTYYASSPDMPPVPAKKINSGEEKLEVEGEALKKRMMAQPNRLVIPDSFHHSYLEIFPKEPKETTLQFRERKRAAYLRSLEIQDFEAHRQPMSSTVEHGEQQIAGEFLAKPHEVGSQFKSNAGDDGEQEMKTKEAIVNPLEFDNQMKSSAFDDEDLPDYESDMDI